MQNPKFYILEISWKPHDGNFFETICWEIAWKLYAGKFLETICWEIWVDTSGFLMGVIMAQCHGITLQFQSSSTWSSVEHPSSADLSRTKQNEAREVIGSVEQGDGDAQPTLVPMRVHGG